MLMSPRRRAPIGWRGFQLPPESAGARGASRGRRRQPAPCPARPAASPQTPGPPRRAGLRTCGRLLSPRSSAPVVNPSGVQDDNPTPRPAVQAEDGISAEASSQVSKPPLGPEGSALRGHSVTGRGACPQEQKGMACSSAGPAPALSHIRGSQLPCCEDAPAILCRGPRGEELRPPATSRVNAPAWKWILQLHPSLQVKKPRPTSQLQSHERP
ncbi:uncharacterized protein LOC105861705 [Microcebus murinus]|uniref:uncharacterized protein LOC105861705 n=1 Tax=Microcebus murinus TaxID=30608 RepID=UPI003F6B6EAF